MITRLIWTIWTPMSSVLKRADKLNLSLSLYHTHSNSQQHQHSREQRKKCPRYRYYAEFDKRNWESLTGDGRRHILAELVASLRVVGVTVWRRSDLWHSAGWGRSCYCCWGLGLAAAGANATHGLLAFQLGVAGWELLTRAIMRAMLSLLCFVIWLAHLEAMWMSSHTSVVRRLRVTKC